VEVQSAYQQSTRACPYQISDVADTGNPPLLKPFQRITPQIDLISPDEMDEAKSELFIFSDTFFWILRGIEAEEPSG
jgi:hypothetical protein